MTLCDQGPLRPREGDDVILREAFLGENEKLQILGLHFDLVRLPIAPFDPWDLHVKVLLVNAASCLRSNNNNYQYYQK